MNKTDKNRITGRMHKKPENSDLKKILNSPTANDKRRFSTLHPDDDKVVFVPEEEIRAIKSIYDKMEQARLEFCRVAEEMKKAEVFEVQRRLHSKCNSH